MTAFAVKGWCPGALRPMESGDGWVVRVRPRGGRLSPEQAAGIASLSLAHGNGLIDLSARANVQLRGVTMASHAPLIDGLRALGLIDADEGQEARRNIIVTPFAWPGDAPDALASRLADALAACDLALPGKFGFALDSGAVPVLRATSADIRIERQGDGFLVRADGAKTGALVAAADVAETALALARWFVSSGGVTAGRGRMAAHLAAGAVLPAAFLSHPRTEAMPFVPTPGPVSGGVMVALAFGQMQAETLAALAGLGPLRITPWRMLLVEGAGAVDLPDLITDPADPLLRVVACTGAPGCPQAHRPTRPLARSLAASLPPGRLLHVSGCAKGCAHPAACDITLTAGPRGWGLIRQGRAGDLPRRADLTLEDLIPEVLTP